MKIKVTYNGDIIPELDIIITEALTEKGFSWYAQGMDINTKIRDINFDTPAIERPTDEEITQGKEEVCCEWAYDDYHDMYETSCDGAFCFPDGNLNDNEYKYCPKCGKKIKDGE